MSEMRNLLSGVHDILDALNHNDTKQAASAARAIGTASAADQAYAQAMQLFAQRTPDSIRQAIVKAQEALALYEHLGDPSDPSYRSAPHG